MTLTGHVVCTGAAVAVLAPFVTPTEAALFAAGAVLIDVDHYFVYVQRRRRFDVRGMFRYYARLQPIQRSIPYFGLCVFHTIDFFLLLALLAWVVHPLWSYLLAGCLYHFVLDLYDLRRKKVLRIRAFLLVEHLIRRCRSGYPWY